MKRSILTLGVSMVLLLAIGLVPALSQKAEPKPMDPAKIVEEFMKLHQPGDEHKALQMAAGEYLIEGKMWMDPTKDPMEVKGFSSIRKLGSTFVHEEITLSCSGKKMWVEGFMGYDNESKKFQATYIGDFATTQRMMTGTWNAKTSTAELSCEYTCPITGSKMTERLEAKHDGKGNMTLTFYMKIEGMGNEFKSGEMKYTRL